MQWRERALSSPWDEFFERNPRWEMSSMLSSQTDDTKCEACAIINKLYFARRRSYSGTAFCRGYAQGARKGFSEGAS